MIVVGLKCSACRMWSRIPIDDLPRFALQDYYYCDECEAKVSWNVTSASIKFN